MLKRNLEPAKAREIREDFARLVEEAGATVDEALRLPRGRGAQLVARTYALTRGLWQSLADENALGFQAELSEALAEYWRGALASS